MIVTIDEHQHLNNDYVCSFCGNENKRVVGRAYRQSRYDYPVKHYMFSYCADCCLRESNKMMRVVPLNNHGAG